MKPPHNVPISPKEVVMLAIMTVWVTIQGNGHFARNGIINTVSDPGLPMPYPGALSFDWEVGSATGS
jgi:uncharacterized membrane protein